MRARPVDLDGVALRRGLGAFGLGAAALEHSPVGFGDHHWRVHQCGRGWFATVFDLRAKPYCGAGPAEVFSRLAAALRAAQRVGPGLAVAAVEDRGGAVVHRLGPHYALSVFPLLVPVGAAGDREIAELLVRLHGCAAPAVAPGLSPELPGRAVLERALEECGIPWRGGPMSEPARRALRGVVSAVRARLVEHDRGLARLAGRARVLTHGEPHAGNVVVAAEGARLVDWDTAALAVPERDLAVVPGAVEHYVRCGGREPDERVLELFRLRWDLADVAELVGWFRAPHGATADVRTAWEGFAAAVRRCGGG